MPIFGDDYELEQFIDYLQQCKTNQQYIDQFIICSQLLQTLKRKQPSSTMAAVKNITNGQFELDFDAEDRVGQNYKFVRTPGGDVFDIVRRRDPSISTKYYIQNLRTGSFSQISQKYQMESKSSKSQQTSFTTNTFQTQMFELRTSIQTKLSKSISFFQGIFAGMALLFTITLNLSSSVSQDLVRVQDQSIRCVSLLSTFGSFFSMIRARDRYFFIKLRGSSSQVDQRYKTFVLCLIQMLFYSSSYMVFNISHVYSVEYNIQASSYQQLQISTAIYTALCLVGWIITNINSKKHEK